MKNIEADVKNWFIFRGAIISAVSGFLLSLFIYLGYGSNFGQTFSGIILTSLAILTIFVLLAVIASALGMMKHLSNQLTLWVYMVFTVFVAVEIYNLFICFVFGYAYLPDPLFVKNFFINKLINFVAVAIVTSSVYFCDSSELQHIFRK